MFVKLTATPCSRIWIVITSAPALTGAAVASRRTEPTTAAANRARITPVLGTLMSRVSPAELARTQSPPGRQVRVVASRDPGLKRHGADGCFGSPSDAL